MKLISPLSTFAIFISVATAAAVATKPSARSASTIEDHSTRPLVDVPLLGQYTPTWNFYVCKEKNWLGDCINIPAHLDQCYEFGYDDLWDYRAQVSSAGPSDGNKQCTLFTEWGCAGRQLQLKFPGVADLSAVGNDFDNAALSFRCSAYNVVHPVT